MENPIQPIYLDEFGNLRFKANAIIRFYLDTGRINMNDVINLPGISQTDREQFAQLIGYSLAGFSELPYVSDATVARANEMAKTCGIIQKSD